MGTPDFAVPSLRKLQKSDHQIVSVVTVPDRPQGRGRKLTASAIKVAAHELALPVLQPESISDPDFIHEIKSLEPDLIVVVAFQILPPELYGLPARGSFNLHASLLPRYRGAAPIHWALLNGDTESGVTTFFLQRKVDTGSMLLQRSVPIQPEDNLGSLHDKLAAVGADVVLETVNGIAEQNLTTTAQDNGLATRAPKVGAEDRQLNFAEDVEQCNNRIRAFAPRPGAITSYAGQSIKILKATPVAGTGAPGEILQADSSALVIACGTDALAVHEIQPEGKRAMPVADFLHGNTILPGATFG